MAESKVERPRGSLDAELQQAAITLALLVTAPPGVPVNVDVIDRAARLLGIIYGNVGQLQQRAVTGEALVQLRSGGAEIDPRTIRALVATDILGVVDALGNRMPAGDADARAVHTQEATPTTIVEGQVTMTGAAQQFPADACRSITIENPIANAIVAIGHDNAVTLLNGYILRPGAQWNLAIDNANRVWCIGTVGNIISYGGVA